MTNNKLWHNYVENVVTYMVLIEWHFWCFFSDECGRCDICDILLRHTCMWWVVTLWQMVATFLLMAYYCTITLHYTSHYLYALLSILYTGVFFLLYNAVRRCVDFSRRWNFGKHQKQNIYLLYGLTEVSLMNLIAHSPLKRAIEPCSLLFGGCCLLTFYIP